MPSHKSAPIIIVRIVPGFLLATARSAAGI